MEIKMNLNVMSFFAQLIANRENSLNNDEFNLYIDMIDIISFIIEPPLSIRNQSIINEYHKGSIVYANRKKL